jgi:hypothetical protein
MPPNLLNRMKSYEGFLNFAIKNDGEVLGGISEQSRAERREWRKENARKF